MVEPTKVCELVTAATEDAFRVREVAVPDQIGADTKLFGAEGSLDSLGLVSLLIDVEQRLEEKFGVVVTIADDRAMSQRRSPFRTVGTLSDYVCALLATNDHGE